MVDRPTDLGSLQAILDQKIAAAQANPAASVAQIKAQALAILEVITLQPKPDYTINGKTVRHADYARSLMDLVTWADDTEATVASAETYELETEAF